MLGMESLCHFRWLLLCTTATGFTHVKDSKEREDIRQRDQDHRVQIS